MLPPGTRKRRDAAGASGSGRGGGDRTAALLGALGLGRFSRLDLPVPPDGLDLAASVDLASDRVAVTLGGYCVTLSPADLAAALALPLGTVALAPEIDAAVFSIPEAIAAVKGFVHDRLLLLGSGGGSGAFPEEVVVALQLVEEGKAYEVDWGGLVWALLKRAVFIGNPWLYSHYLLRLMKCQKPELFSDVDAMILLGKRRKCLSLQQRGRTDEQLVDWSKAGMEEENLLHRNSSNYQLFAAEPEMEEGLAFGVSQNIGDTMILGDNSYYQCQGAEEGVEARLVSLTCHNIGESQEMPTFGYRTIPRHIIATEDQEGDGNVNVGPSPPLIANHSSFPTCLEEIIALARDIDNAILNKDKVGKDTQAEIQHLMEKKEEKDNQINSIVEDTMKDLQASDKISKILKHDKMTMNCTVQQLEQKLKETTNAFQEYKKIVSGESDASSLDAVGMADHLDQIQLFETINKFQKHWFAKSSACAEKITMLAKWVADLNNEVQRLKDFRSIPDLNNGGLFLDESNGGPHLSLQG